MPSPLLTSQGAAPRRSPVAGGGGCHAAAGRLTAGGCHVLSGHWPVMRAFLVARPGGLRCWSLDLVWGRVLVAWFGKVVARRAPIYPWPMSICLSGLAPPPTSQRRTHQGSLLLAPPSPPSAPLFTCSSHLPYKSGSQHLKQAARPDHWHRSITNASLDRPIPFLHQQAIPAPATECLTTRGPSGVGGWKSGPRLGIPRPALHPFWLNYLPPSPRAVSSSDPDIITSP